MRMNDDDDDDDDGDDLFVSACLLDTSMNLQKQINR